MVIPSEKNRNFGNVPKLRDDLTEGYNIIPNFFISAKMAENLSFSDQISSTDREHKCFNTQHFNNRLFDRDTLLVFHYDVNFLYVVSLYARHNEHQKFSWKNRVRKMFRDEIQKMLDERYEFYRLILALEKNYSVEKQKEEIIDAAKEKFYLEEFALSTNGKID